MFCQVNNSIKSFISSALLIILLPSLLVAVSPVFKDDFLCYDSTVVPSSRVSAVHGSLGGNNIITQLNKIDTIPSSWDVYWIDGFSRFNTSGEKLQSYEPYIPFYQDSTFIGIGSARSYAYSSEKGMTAIVAMGTDYQQYVFVIDSTGQSVVPPKCVNCDMLPVGYLEYFYRYNGAINNNSKVAVVSYFDPTDFVFVRIYDYLTDSLSPVIDPNALTLPVIDEPGYWGGHNITRNPSIGIAADGSFAVAWIVHGDYFERIFYVAYNADYTPKTEVQMVDCSSNWSDSANCTGEGIENVDLVMEADGDFYIAWSAFQWLPIMNVSQHVWVRGFNADGSPKYDPVRVNDTDSLNFDVGEIGGVKLACDDSGNLLVGWSDPRNYPERHVSPKNVYTQKVDPNGNLVGYNYRINNISESAGMYDGALGLNNSGQAMILWRNSGDSLPYIAAQLMPYDDVGRFVPGDVTYDRVADILDLVAVVDYMFGGVRNTFWPRSLIDFDGSGQHDISDLNYLINYMFVDGPVPVIPDEGIRPNPGKVNL